MEREAIRAARRPLYDALVRIGRVRIKTVDMGDLPGSRYDEIPLTAAFDGLSAADIDSIIESVIAGFRASMTQASARGEVPF